MIDIARVVLTVLVPVVAAVASVWVWDGAS